VSNMMKNSDVLNAVNVAAYYNYDVNDKYLYSTLT